jgi:hypothetical protein
MKPRSSAVRAIAATALVLSLLLNLLWVGLNVGDLRDYGSFITAGKAQSDGDNPYGVYEDTYRTTFDGEDIDLPNLNPPVSIYGFQALAEVNPGLGKGAIVTLSAALYAGVIVALMLRYPEKKTPLIALWAVSLAGVWHVLELGQIYIPLLAATTGAWLVQDRRPLLAGVLIGLTIAMKPTFAIWPLLLLLSGERKTSLSALATAASVSAVPLVLDGPGIYRQWLDASSAFTGLEMPANSALIAVFARMGLDEVGIAASIGVVAALVRFAMRSHPTPEQVASAAIIGALLLGPITWSGYSLFVLPVLMARPWQGWEKVAAVLLAVPVPVVLLLMPLNIVTTVLVGPLYGWSLLILFGLVMRDGLRSRPAVESPTPLRTRDDQEAIAA